MSWVISETEMRTELKFASFADAITFIHRASYIIEKLDHHPEWTNVYDRIKITLSTHSAGNKVTEKDHKLAKAIDALYEKFK